MPETKPKHPGGRPQHLTPEQIQKVADDFKKYIETEEDPTIVGFTSSYPPVFSKTLGRETYINKNFIGDHNEFSELRKLAIEKQEAYIVKGVTQNKLNATMGVFRLKQPQHGYTDRQLVETRNIDLTTSEEENEKMKKVIMDNL